MLWCAGEARCIACFERSAWQLLGNVAPCREVAELRDRAAHCPDEEAEPNQGQDPHHDGEQRQGQVVDHLPDLRVQKQKGGEQQHQRQDASEKLQDLCEVPPHRDEPPASHREDAPRHDDIHPDQDRNVQQHHEQKLRG